MPTYSRTARTFSLCLACLVSTLQLSGTQAANPPRIEYVLVLNAHGKPQTSFHSGATVRFRVELYLASRSARGVETVWRVQSGKHRLLNRTVHGSFRGPGRGDLFTQTQSLHLPAHPASGTYTVSTSLTIGSRHLSRTARFYVRR
jgi:hypothetical protein